MYAKTQNCEMLLCEPNIPSQEDLCRVYLTIENIAFVVITE